MPAARRHVPTMGLTHLALRVRDPHASAEFYRRVLGARVTYDDGEHVEVRTPRARDCLAFERAPKRAGKPGGVIHFGFRLRKAADIDAAVRAVKEAGGKVKDVGEFSRGHPYLFFDDPDGYEVEIWYE